MRSGERMRTYELRQGRRGVLKIREHGEWVDTGSDANGDTRQDQVATGTWRVVPGTGA
jgi:hypothetical protein